MGRSVIEDPVSTDPTGPLDEKGGMPLPDYHLHTPLCKHARGEPVEYRLHAKHIGLLEICFTDHVPAPDGYDPDHRMALEEFPVYQRQILSLHNGQAPEVLMGIEADYYEGCTGFLQQWLPVQMFDYVLGSVHFIDDWGFDNPGERQIWDSVDVTATWQHYFGSIRKMIGTGLFDAIGHLDLPKKFGYRPVDRDLREMVCPVLDDMARAGMGMEVNTSGLRKPVGEIYPSLLILTLARERDIPICFGSDAHLPSEVGSGFSEALRWVREAGYTHYFRIKRHQKRLIPLPQSL